MEWLGRTVADTRGEGWIAAGRLYAAAYDEN
nr:MAG TPA: hypothetical protein [Caudoviricetes sp.]